MNKNDAQNLLDPICKTFGWNIDVIQLDLNPCAYSYSLKFKKNLFSFSFTKCSDGLYYFNCSILSLPTGGLLLDYKAISSPKHAKLAFENCYFYSNDKSYKNS